jgi:thymidylate kinase
MLSAIRFAYYFLDYFVGQFVVFWRHTMRGEVVIYDRYYFDFIVDPRRTNLRLNPHAVEFLYRWLLKPDLNFFLFASADAILGRKRELPRDVVEELTRRYGQLFNRLQRRSRGPRYHVVENVDLQATLVKVSRVIARSL